MCTKRYEKKSIHEVSAYFQPCTIGTLRARRKALLFEKRYWNDINCVSGEKRSSKFGRGAVLYKTAGRV